MYLCLGVRAWGDIIMTDSENWKERRNQVARYRAMEQETTDPLAARLLHDIVLDLEAELEGLQQERRVLDAAVKRRYWPLGIERKSLGLVERMKTAPACRASRCLRLTP